jgi:periplasmic protein TonB
VIWSLAVHLFVFGWALRAAPKSAAPQASPRSRTVEFVAQLGSPRAPAGMVAAGQLLAPRELGPDAPTVPGPADAWQRDSASPWPNADIDTPDERAAARGGGQTGGTPSWTGRNDRDQELHAQPWNDPDTYRLEHHADARQRRSPESILRESSPDVDNAHRDRRRKALVGERAPAPQPDQGDPRPRDPGEGPLAGSPAPPVDDRTSQKTRPGAIVTHEGRPAAKEGAEATDAPREHGPRSDNANAAQASNEPHPIPLELSRPSSGGLTGEGVAGPTPGGGNSAQAPRAGTGQGGSPADLAQRPGGQASTRARAQEAYLKRLYKRVQDHLVYPPELAASLEQGEVVVKITLRTDGTVVDVRVSRPSGYKEFDEAAVRAVRKAAPFDPVPPLLRGGRDAVPLDAPITFANPIIR